MSIIAAVLGRVFAQHGASQAGQQHDQPDERAKHECERDYGERENDEVQQKHQDCHGVDRGSRYCLALLLLLNQEPVVRLARMVLEPVHIT